MIDGLSFTLEGGVLAILGPSGCGKTTLLNVLAGVLPKISGNILFHGRPLNPSDAAIGLIPQSYGLLPWKTVRQNCLFCASLRHKTAEPEALAQRLGIGALLDRYPRELSGGQAQRAALARALLMEPDLLLLDEPFAALDLAAAARARRLCGSLFQETGVTALAVTHRPDDALYLGDSIAVMEPRGFRCILQNPWRGTEGAETGRMAFAARLEKEILAIGERGLEP